MIEPLPFQSVAGAFHQLRQLGEHGRRVAFGRGRLADGQRDLALRHREAGQRIHDQQHVLALVTEIFGDRGRVSRALQAHQRGSVRRRGDHNRMRHAFLAENVIDEFLHFAAALADQTDHGDIRAGIARHHAEQHALADAAAGEQSPCAAPARRSACC